VRTSASARAVRSAPRPTCSMAPLKLGTESVCANCTGRRYGQICELGRGDAAPSGGETGQCLAHVAFAQALQRAVAQLAHALARDAEHAADLLEGVLAPAGQAEVEAQHLRVARRERAERGLDLFAQEVVHRRFFGGALVVGDE